MNKVSIVITTYRRPVQLLEALQSCLDQTYPPYEIIIGDDSPDDLSMEAIQKMSGQTDLAIRYIKNEPALKQAMNVNMLFNQAKGDYVLLLHDDDLLLPTCLEILISCFVKNPEIGIAFGKQYIITEDGTVSIERSEGYNGSYFRSSEYNGNVLTPFEAGMGQQIPNNAYLIRSEIVKDIQFRTNDGTVSLGNGCEYDFGLRLGVAGHKMFFVDEYTAKYRVASNSMSGSKSDDAGYQAFRLIKSVKTNSKRAEAIKKLRLQERAPIAITQAVNIGLKKEAWKIYFSKWYYKRILSVGGMKRLLYLIIK
jgi:glycosyltransferase involved in cell wall biosynthesis